jgi:hypothetical protein
MVDRRELGQKKVGMPLVEVFNAFAQELASMDGSALEGLEYYGRKMLFASIPMFMDHALSDAELAKVDARAVKRVGVRLVADMMRQTGGAEARIGPLVRSVAKKLKVKAEVGERFDLSSPKAEWAKALGKELGVPPLMLFVAHAALVEGVAKPEIRGGKKPTPKASRRRSRR